MIVPAADPHWDWLIIWYFYLGGIAAGSYFLATMAQLSGTARDRRLTRVGYLIAAPLIAICGILLIVDLNRPERFWHMLLDPGTGLPHGKLWSPMSIGAWGVLLFSLFSTVAFCGAVVELDWVGDERWRQRARGLHRGWWGKTFDFLGAACALFLGSYTGALLTATNQPAWSESAWIGALFLASSAGSGIAAIQLFSPDADWRHGLSGEPDPGSSAAEPAEAGHSALRAIEPWTWTLELLMIVFVFASWGMPTLRILVAEGMAVPFLGGVVGLGIVLPGFLWWRSHKTSPGLTSLFTALAVLVGAFVLRYSVVKAPTVIRESSLTASYAKVVPTPHRRVERPDGGRPSPTVTEVEP